MSFDLTNPTDVAALKSELTTDPAGVGYNLNASISRIVRDINDPDVNPGSETTEREFDAAALMEALTPTDYDSQQTVAGAPNYVHTLIELQAYTSIEPYKAKFRSMFANNSATVTALDAQNRKLSRAEVLFGVGTTIQENDVNTALSS